MKTTSLTEIPVSPQSKAKDTLHTPQKTHNHKHMQTHLKIIAVKKFNTSNK